MESGKSDVLSDPMNLFPCHPVWISQLWHHDGPLSPFSLALSVHPSHSSRRYTQYIPLSIYELQSWLGTPSIYVLDCSAAGLIINAFRAFMDQRPQQGVVRWGQGNQAGGTGGS